MQRTLREHISYLEAKIEALKKGLGNAGVSLSDQNEMKIDLDFAERSLEHFRKAYELERKVADRASRWR